MKHCPHIRSPRKDCHCAKLSSQAIDLTLRYCCDQFSRCSIFIEIQRDASATQPLAANA